MLNSYFKYFCKLCTYFLKYYYYYYYYYYDHHYTFFEVMRSQTRHNCPAYVSFLRILVYARLSSHDITLIRESVGARHSTMVVAEEIWTISKTRRAARKNVSVRRFAVIFRFLFFFFFFFFIDILLARFVVHSLKHPLIQRSKFLSWLPPFIRGFK